MNRNIPPLCFSPSLMHILPPRPSLTSSGYKSYKQVALALFCPIPLHMCCKYRCAQSSSTFFLSINSLMISVVCWLLRLSISLFALIISEHPRHREHTRVILISTSWWMVLFIGVWLPQPVATDQCFLYVCVGERCFASYKLQTPLKMFKMFKGNFHIAATGILHYVAP